MMHANEVSGFRTRTKQWVVLAAGIALLGAGTGCSKVAEAFGGSFKDSYQESFTKSCTDSAVKEGADHGVVAPMCACFAKHLVDHNETGALTTASLNPEGSEFQGMLAAASTACTAGASVTQ